MVSIIGLISMCVRKLKGMNLGEESLHLGFHCGVSMIGGCDFGCVLGCGGCVFVLADLEACNPLIYDGVGVVEYHFVNCSVGLPEIKVSFL